MRIEPVTVKDFKEGQTIAVLQLNRGRNKEPEIYERKVSKIGRKYITDDRGVKYCREPYLNEGLVQSAKYGDRAYIFPKVEEAEEYIEKYKIAIWLSKLSFGDTRMLPLWKLREAERLLKK